MFTISQLKETIKIIFIALILHFLLRTFIVETFRIPSSSMMPNIMVGDHIIVSKYSYGYGPYSSLIPVPLSKRVLFSEPQRGDIIVFHSTNGDGNTYIKRLIGLPGDKITLYQGLIEINNKPVKLEEVTQIKGQYQETIPDNKTYPIIQGHHTLRLFFPHSTSPYVVPEGHYFFMGDNRDNSKDSRFTNFMGMVPANNLIGKAQFVLWNTNGMLSRIKGNSDANIRFFYHL